MNGENEKSTAASEAAALPYEGLTVRHANLFYLMHTVLALGLSAIKISDCP